MPDKKAEGKKNFAENKKYLLAFVAATAVLFALYKVLLYFYESHTTYILGGFMAAGTIAALAYVIYNRGLSRKNITADMLPDSMTTEEKTEFIEDGKKRIAKSKILLVFVLAIFFTFFLDLTEMFVSSLI